MTREEHIENLKAIASNMPSDKCADWIESLMAGVKALEQEPCEDAISRQAVIDTLTKTSGIRGDALKALYDLPSVTPQPKMGRWITLKDEYGDVTEAVCSCCDKNGNHKWAFCPYCGQPKMQEVEE